MSKSSNPPSTPSTMQSVASIQDESFDSDVTNLSRKRSCILSTKIDHYVSVNNFLMLKHIKDNPDDGNGLFIVGTIIQYINDEEGDFVKEEDNVSFPIRINDENAKDFVDHRKTERNGKVSKSTFSVKAPLDIVDVFDQFPYRIMKAKLTVELSTKTCNKKTVRVHPQLCLNIKAKSSNISLQNPDVVHDDIDSKMDKSVNFDFVSVVPHVAYIVKNGKECQKFEVTFYLTESGASKFVKVVCPMLLVCVMNYFHVMTNQIDETNHVISREYLGNSATFALTIAVLFEHVIPKSRKNSLFCHNTIFLMLVFLALILSSIPAKDNYYGKLPSQIGSYLFCASFIIPLWNTIAYYLKINEIHRDLVTRKEDFEKDSEAVFDASDETHKYDDFYKRIVDLVNGKGVLQKEGYIANKQGKNTIVKYAKYAVQSTTPVQNESA